MVCIPALHPDPAFDSKEAVITDFCWGEGIPFVIEQPFPKRTKKKEPTAYFAGFFVHLLIFFQK
jgi:hypothetical protein